jgi:hypothetical protein
MSDARWIEIDGAIASAVRHFKSAAAIHDTLRNGRPDLDSYLIEMGFMHATQAGHSSLENALVRILGLFDEERPSGAQWHADLIRRIGQAVGDRPPVMSPDLAKAASETRQFRDVAVRAYDYFDWERTARAVGFARQLAAALPGAIATFRAATDP